MTGLHIEKFIGFVLDLTEELYREKLEPMNAQYYFFHGGCLDLAGIILHYFPDGEIVKSRKEEHYAVLYKGSVYDASIIKQNPENFRKMTKEDYKNIEMSVRNEISFSNHTDFVSYLIHEIDEGKVTSIDLLKGNTK